MTTKQINDIRARIDGLIESRRLRDAFALLRNTARGEGAHRIDDTVAQLEQNYAYMLRYLTDGMDDPDRQRVYDDIIAGLYSATDSLVRQVTANEAPTLYYNKLRYRQLHSSDDLAKMFESSTHGEVFEALWTRYPLSAADVATIEEGMRFTVPARRLIIITALTMALLEFYDERALRLLIDTYKDSNDIGDTAASARALVGILLALYRHRHRPVSRDIQTRLNLLGDTAQWRSDVRMAFIEMIRTRDTERITRQMTEDIIPGMQHIDPSLMQRLQQGFESEDIADLAENPEWQEMLDKSGIADRLKQLGEMQQEGADVFMATFSHLKMFPFFNDITSWFMPFSRQHPAVVRTGIDRKITELIEAMPMLCDNDKYSFVFALEQVPAEQRNFMLSQISAQNEQMLEAMRHETEANLPAEQRRRAVANYLQSLNRFYKLFRRKGEFYDPFAHNINLLRVKPLSTILDIDTLRAVAEFFLKVQLYDDALDAFVQVDTQGDPDPVVFEKLGWCHYKLGHPRRAIDYYQQAELFNPDNIWLIKQLAAASRAAGDTVQTVDYARRLADLDADNVRTIMQLGYAYLQNNQLDDALNTFYKIEFTTDDPTPALRPIAWTLFAKGQFAKADAYYARILASSPQSNDYLNMGHNALGAGRIKDAINYYKLSLETSGSDTQHLLEAIDADREALERAGVDPATISLVTDALLYSIN